jgi:hypothetical protein
LDFLNLQIYLLMEFHCDLATAMEQAQSSPLSSELLAYLNASHYIVCVLQQWGEEPVSGEELVSGGGACEWGRNLK